VLSSALAFRPASVVERLPPRSGACPLSLRDLLAAARASAMVLPLVRAPISGVARGALVAAKELRAVVGLALPPGVPSRPWFDAVTRAADELAAGVPIFLSADVVVEGEGATQIERSVSEAWRLVDDGMTHLAIDVAAVTPPERGRIAGEVAQAAFDRGISVEVVVPLGEGARVGPLAAALFEDASRRGVTPDLAGLRCPAPADADEARVQAVALARISQALDGIPMIRRGPVTPRLLELLRASPVKACEDGGVAAAGAVSLIPLDLVEEPGAGQRESPLERAAAALSPEVADRLEARAYVEALDLIERLGGRNGAAAVIDALERSREDR
jgi:hypothetical protein